MTGLLITDINNEKNPHPQYIRSNTTTTFDSVNDRVKIEQDSLNIYWILLTIAIPMNGITRRVHILEKKLFSTSI